MRKQFLTQWLLKVFVEEESLIGKGKSAVEFYSELQDIFLKEIQPIVKEVLKKVIETK